MFELRYTPVTRAELVKPPAKGAAARDLGYVNITN